MNEMAVVLLERSAKRFGIPKDDILAMVAECEKRGRGIQ